MSICEWFIFLPDFNPGWACVFLFCCAFCLCVTQTILLSHLQTKHQLVCMLKFSLQDSLNQHLILGQTVILFVLVALESQKIWIQYSMAVELDAD